MEGIGVVRAVIPIRAVFAMRAVHIVRRIGTRRYDDSFDFFCKIRIGHLAESLEIVFEWEMVDDDECATLIVDLDGVAEEIVVVATTRVPVRNACP